MTLKPSAESSAVPDPREHAPDCPDQLAQILLRALAFEAADRPADIGVVAGQLRAFVAASGRVDQREQLASLMQVLFSAEQAEHQQAIAELRSNGTGSVRPAARAPKPADPARTPRGHLRRRWTVATLAGAISLVALTAGLLATNGKAPNHGQVSPAEPSPKSVTVEVTWQPPTQATVDIDGREISARPARIALPRSNQPVTVRVRAPGFNPADLKVTPSDDRFLIVPLTKARPAASLARTPPSPASSQKEKADPAPAATPAPPRSTARSARTKGDSTKSDKTKASDSSRPAPARPPSSPAARPKGGIVTDYPF